MNPYKMVRKLLSPLRKKYIEKKYKRLFKKKGSKKLNNKKKIYYIIRRYPREAGFFSNYLYVLSHMAYARKLGYVPIVDMENYPTYYNEKTLVKGTKNAWEYYFRQVDGTLLKEAYKSKNYVLSENSFQKQGMRLLNDIYFFPLEDDVEVYCQLCEKIQMECTLKKELEEETQKLFSGGGKVLGVHVRGTDMKNGNFQGHPGSLSIISYIEMVEIFLERDSEIKKIFLATDEKAIEVEFRNKYGKKIHVSEAYRAVESTDMGIHYTINRDREDHYYLLGKEVVRDAYLLSKCDKLICGLSNVASAAIIWNHNRYEKIGVLCKEDYRKNIVKEIKKRNNIDVSRYVIKSNL